jgi:hypothetical protein
MASTCASHRIESLRAWGNNYQMTMVSRRRLWCTRGRRCRCRGREGWRARRRAEDAAKLALLDDELLGLGRLELLGLWGLGGGGGGAVGE